MNCLTPGQIYLYLEEDLPLHEKEVIAEHIASCEACQNILEDRRVMMDAIKSLPLLDMPADFTQQVMAKVFPKVSSVRIWIAGLATGFSLMMFIFLAVFLQSDVSLPDSFVRLNETLWTMVRNLSVFTVKLFKVAAVIVEILVQFASFVIKTLARLTSFIRPEVQIFLIMLSLVLFISVMVMMRRKIWTGEKT